MSTNDFDFSRHIGRKMTAVDVATAYPVKALIVTFDRDEAAPGDNEPIPPGWHGLYFLPTPRRETLGVDGLPTETGVLPPMPFPRRMYAGERLRFHRPIRIGDRLERETELLDITLKEGSTGKLAFTTLIHRIYGPDGLAVEEERDTVFREEASPAQTEKKKPAAPSRDAVPGDLPWRRSVHPDPVMLFRFSALTFNGHRIHYDRPYAMKEEGYPGIVVHGPFTSLLMMDFARDNNPGRTMTSYSMRARAPLYDTAPYTIVGGPAGDKGRCDIWALTPEGAIAMSASATFA